MLDANGAEVTAPGKENGKPESLREAFERFRKEKQRAAKLEKQRTGSRQLLAATPQDRVRFDKKFSSCITTCPH